ncbi:MFS transporter [Dermabacteraceae bacterium TAE3-ERU27]|nr:MFS transporter [Dermabacteraceae bacterium TAE3-ERU27]
MTVRPALVRRAQYLMIAGLLTSFIGSQVIEGAATGLVALGILPVVWVPLYATLTDLQDSLAAPIARLVEKYDPGRVLMACEGIDVVISLLALALVLTLGESYLAPVLICYLVLVSILPLIVDLAEEFYLNDIGQVDAQLVLRANTIVAVGTGAAGLTLGRPLGALFSATGITFILALNIALSGLAMFLRWRSAVAFCPAHVLEEEEEEPAEGLLAGMKHFLLPHSPRRIFSFGFLSPLFSFFVALAPAIVATYVLLWLAGEGEHPALRLGGMLLAMGAAKTLTPLLVARLMRNRQGAAAGTMLLLFLCTILAGYASALAAIALLPAGNLRLFLVLAALIVAGSAASGERFAVSTLRQSCLSQADFRTVLGWSYSLTSLGGIAGSWLGYTLQTAHDPRPALLCATLAVAALTVWVIARRVSLPEARAN